MLKVKTRWSGFLGGPGWTNFYFDDVNGGFEDGATAVAVADKVATFWGAVKTKLPPAVTLQIQSDVEVIGAADGQLAGVLNAGARAAINGTAVSQPYSAATGAVITWRTAGVRNGRRVRGRTFLVPCVSGMFQNDGTITSSDLTELQAAAQALFQPAGAVSLGIFSRPTAVGAADGAFFPVTSATVPDLAAVLRSRRD